mgnify:CR=1 FL=1
MIKNPSYLLCLGLTLTLVSSFVVRSRETYDKAESKDMVYYAGLAYCPKKCLLAWDCESGKQFTNFGEVTHVNNAITLASAYIGYEKKKNLIIVSYRGSANAQNWIEDFNFEMVSYPNCKGCYMHAGFLEDYKAIEGKTEEAIEKLLKEHPGASIVTTGHSLGAALSVIAGLRLKAKFGSSKVIVHNFGCPRVGNHAMAQYISTRVDTVFRVIHNKDLVAHLPFEYLDYRHPAFEVFWDEKMTNYTVCNESGEDKECSDKFSPDFSAGDHDFYFIPISSLKC